MVILTSRNEEPNIVIQNLEDVAFWLNVHQRYSVQDAKRMNEIEDRIRRLERVPFVRLWLRLTNG